MVAAIFVYLGFSLFVNGTCEMIRTSKPLILSHSALPISIHRRNIFHLIYLLCNNKQMNKLELYNKVLELRSQGFSYTQIQEVTGTHRRTICDWVTGKSDPSRLKGLNNCKVSDDVFVEIVKENCSVSSCLKAQNLKPLGANYKGFYKRIERLGLDTSHFTGQGYLKDKQNKYVPEFSIEEAFVVGGSLSSFNLNKKIQKYNLKPYFCEECGLDKWRDKSISLHLDHINGINNDNRLENLRFLCPNCHSQTDTYCGKSKGSYDLV